MSDAKTLMERVDDLSATINALGRLFHRNPLAVEISRKAKREIRGIRKGLDRIQKICEGEPETEKQVAA